MEATATAHILPTSYAEVCIVQPFPCIQFGTKFCLFERLKDYFSSNCIEENCLRDCIILHLKISFTSERAPASDIYGTLFIVHTITSNKAGG